MKKIIALFLVLSTLNILTISISAHEDQHNEETKFTFVETIVENEITYRSLKIEDSSSISTDDAKEILYSAGMTYSTINNFSPQQIEDVAKCSEIHSIIEYRKVDKYGSNTNVSGEEAVNHAIQARLPSNPGNDETILDGNGGSYLVQTTSKEENYLRICLNVYKMVDTEKYKYTVTAEWLTKPIYQQTDTLGLLAFHNTIDTSSCYGWMKYDTTLTHYDLLSGYSTSHSSNTEYYGADDFELCIDGGAILMCELPKDSYSAIDNPGMNSYTSIKNNNITIFIECIGLIFDPDSPKNFNVLATYDHKNSAIDFDISLSADISGSVTLGIGYEVHDDIIRTTVNTDHPIRYTP